MRPPRLLAVNSGGIGNLHGLRVRRLTEGFPGDVMLVDLDRSSRSTAKAHMSALIAQGAWDIIYLEGTGIGGGLPLLRAGRKHRYVVSSGDPVAGFFRVTRGPSLGHLFGIYERQLYRRAAAFVGWTPYLTGRALELGARRAITVEGGVDLSVFRPLSADDRRAAREHFGVPADHLVCGVVGSLKWVPRQRYTYGLELAKVLACLRRTDVTMLVVGDGDGRAAIESSIPAYLRHRLVFTGRLAETNVVTAINAMDIGFITQTLDELGSYRLTTKLPEYLACGVPVAMSPVPGFYDYVTSAGFALPAHHPSSVRFASECAGWLDCLSKDAVDAAARNARAVATARSSYADLRERFQRFLVELASPYPATRG